MIEAKKNLATHFEQVNLTKEEAFRFWKKVDKSGPINPDIGTNCWEWTAGIWARGYGAFAFRNGQIKSHRLSYLCMVGPIPKETPFVLHKCDNRKCCNPEHLFLGTYKDNSHDMCAKGRHKTARGDDHRLRKFPEQILKGTQLPQAVLTEEAVSKIRERVRAGEKQNKIAKEFGVCTGTICQIISRKIWKHVP